MLAANHWTEHGVPNGGIKTLKCFATLIGRTTISTNMADMLADMQSSGDSAINKVVYIDPAIFVAEDCLVRHQWE